MIQLSMARATRLGSKAPGEPIFTLETRAGNGVPSLGSGFPLSNERSALLPHMEITDLLLEVEYPQNAMIRWGNYRERSEVAFVTRAGL
jgi:hypothetical protein